MRNYWFYEGQSAPKDNLLFGYIRKHFFNNRVGLAQSAFTKLVFLKYIATDKKIEDLLDIGGAGGHQFDEIKIKNKTRIDIDTDKLKESDKTWKTVQMNAENLKFKSNAFDLITSFQVLEHTKNPLKVMTEMYRTLKPGGKILLTVPDIEAEKFSFYDYYTHIFPFTKKRMYFMIKSCGFKDIIIKKYTAPRFWHFLFPYKKIILPILFTFTRGSLLVIAKK